MLHELTNFQSSNVAAAEYNSDTKDLTVRYHDGTRYRFEGVGHQTWQNLKDAKSTGGFLHSHISKRHNVVKLDT